MSAFSKSQIDPIQEIKSQINAVVQEIQKVQRDISVVEEQMLSVTNSTNLEYLRNEKTALHNLEAALHNEEAALHNLEVELMRERNQRIWSKGKQITVDEAENMLGHFWDCPLEDIDKKKLMAVSITFDDLPQMNAWLQEKKIPDLGVFWCQLSNSKIRVILDKTCLTKLLNKKFEFDSELMKDLIHGTFYMGYPSNFQPNPLHRGIVNELYSNATQVIANKDSLNQDDRKIFDEEPFLQGFLNLLYKYNIFHRGSWNQIQTRFAEYRLAENSVFFETLQPCTVAEEMTWTISLEEWEKTLKLAKQHLCHDSVKTLLSSATEKDKVLAFINRIQETEEKLHEEGFIFDLWFFLYLTVMIVRAHFFIQQSNTAPDVGKIGTRKEAIAGTSMFSPMFQYCSYYLSNDNGRSIPALNLSSLFSIYYKEVFADMASVVVGANDKSSIAPLFIIEYATESPGEDKLKNDVENMMAHQDMSKISVSMAAGMLHLLDLLGDDAWSDDIYPHVRIYGALVYNWTVQFIELQPIHLREQTSESKNAIEMVLNAPPEWCITLHKENRLVLTDMTTVFESIVKVWHVVKGIHSSLGHISSILVRKIGAQQPNAALQGLSKSRYVFPKGAAPYAPNSHTGIHSQTLNKYRRLNVDNNESIDAESEEEDNDQESEREMIIEKASLLLKKQSFIISHYQQLYWNIMSNSEELYQNKCKWHLERQGKNYFGILKFGRHAVQESEFLTKVRSPFIVQVIFAATGPNDAWQLMVQPLLYDDYDLMFSEENVSLHRDRLNNVIQYMDNVLQGLVALHSQFILHCDIKPSNILYDRVNERWIIIDLNCAVQLPSVDAEVQTSNAPGTKGFQSPEIIRKDFYGLSSDIYSFGRTTDVILMETEAVAFPVYRNAMPVNSVKAVDSIREFIILMESNNPKDRPTAFTALAQLQKIEELLNDEEE